MKRILLLVFTFVCASKIFPQSNVSAKHENVVYGMVSGAALLMDIYEPANSNHRAIVVIPGSGFGYPYPDNYNQDPLKNDFVLDSGYLGKWTQILLTKGYTIFIINHRFAPRFHYSEIFADCQRAVRYARYNAKKYGIDPDHIGAFGQSSGATLCSLLGTTDTTIAHAENGIDSSSSKVQAVVALAAPFDLSDFNKKADTSIRNALVLKMILSYMGELPLTKDGEFTLSGKYAEASPISHITKDDAPFLIYYSDNDPIIPTRQATAMYKKLTESNVPARIIMSPGNGHNPIPDMEEIDNWFKKYLK